MFCMMTKGQIVSAWRRRQGLSAAELARRVGTSRQNINNLEADQVDRPHYLPELARVMGYANTDELLALKPPQDLQGQPASLPVEQPRPADRQPSDKVDFTERKVSDSDWATLLDVKLVLPEPELRRIHEEAERIRRVSREQLEVITSRVRGGSS